MVNDESAVVAARSVHRRGSTEELIQKEPMQKEHYSKRNPEDPGPNL
jgi:hypothetical protein